MSFLTLVRHPRLREESLKWACTYLPVDLGHVTTYPWNLGMSLPTRGTKESMTTDDPSATDHLSPSADPTGELASGVSEAAKSLFTAGGAGDTLQRIVDLGVETVDGCDLAGIFLLASGGTITTAALSDPMVSEIDRLQRECGEGPCLDVIAGAAVVYAVDLGDDSRWPHFAPHASDAGIRSALALRLAANATSGALNLYGCYPQAFGIVDRAKGTILATLAGIALSSAQVHDAEEARADNLNAALVTRELIGQAEGILIERERIKPDQAFDILRRASQHLNVKLRDVAQRLVETGEISPTEGLEP